MLSDLVSLAEVMIITWGKQLYYSSSYASKSLFLSYNFTSTLNFMLCYGSRGTTHPQVLTSDKHRF